MAITPADIENMTFSQAGKHEEGYKTDEVDVFLDQVASEVDAMLQKIADLKGRLTTSEQQLAAAQAQVAQLKEQTTMAAPVEPAPVPVPQSEFTASERQISQVLIVAQQSADKLVADARTNAENIRNEADQKAREVIRQALAEKQNELDEIDRLKQSREDFRAEYKKLLQHFMDDADSVFPQQTLSVPNGSKGTTHTDSVVAPTPVIPAAPVADAEATTYAPAPAANDFSDLD
ncbi:DivIVA domain-containing protein [Parafannyhessea umbonata]|jgi:cell division initiation protein|uniref:Cell wall synthesis protein Wag31 n=1 Tax=Parafannyhessea umbonata TaxID=604330 RepID=A0A6N7X652_9ACTN|nr:DivIVA domain-containing protein [Parafannyhessea umbonata]MBM6988539.1 DivIVA domain-containing protein [Parafannyhessea umbonata]MCI6681645.1 DivIVA domain-containing protein [Parafannyhessea umbonata]MCI7219215.1 DivIVA domain-containing protein [Parafannyhessea umbonata]MDD6359863.1 DivIVA domain-containing protein [Parafannyhessea umbonata]MDD6566281.1 DivIVA domain-containing protein [Parafannyhessea umbonata]